MEVLLEDFDRWVNNVYKYQSEIRKIKRDITIGIMISMVLAMLTTVMCSTLNMFSKEPLSITNTLAYQCVSIVFVVLCMLFYIYTRKHYGCDWIGETRTDKQIMRDYNNVFKSEAKKITLKMIPLWGDYAAYSDNSRISTVKDCGDMCCCSYGSVYNNAIYTEKRFSRKN